jgi:hypothetical protein
MQCPHVSDSHRMHVQLKQGTHQATNCWKSNNETTVIIIEQQPEIRFSKKNTFHRHAGVLKPRTKNPPLVDKIIISTE